ncbi:MAG: hypothetical protein ACKV0T_30450 [Planctomycetales bacterium]
MRDWFCSHRFGNGHQVIIWCTLCLGLQASPATSLAVRAADQIVIEVEEFSGTTRAGSPVAYRIQLPAAVPRNTPFALFSADVEPVGAQFTPADEFDRNTSTTAVDWWLDFNAELQPWQVRRYTIRHGAGVQPFEPLQSGHRLTKTEEAYQVQNAPYITWTVPRDLAGLLRSCDFPPSEHLRPDSPGLMLRDRDGKEHLLGAGFHQGRVTRDGRRAVALRFNGESKEPELKGVRSTVDLIFPVPVSWVEVDWTVDDPNARVADLGAVLNLALDPPRGDAPTLVDFGASSWIYASLHGKQTAELVATNAAHGVSSNGAPWQVLRGSAGKLVSMAAGRRETGQPLVNAEGWAHIMDRQRCLALAVDEFATASRDRIAFTADGVLRIWREEDRVADARPATSHHLRFWMHFVFYPPQYSAGTSPRMMQTPPRIRTVE